MLRLKDRIQQFLDQRSGIEFQLDSIEWQMGLVLAIVIWTLLSRSTT